MAIFGKKKREPVVLLEETSPVCEIEAVVEVGEDCVYLYLYYGEGQGVNSCWVCNLKKAPEEVDYKAMEQGQAPMMPARYCKNPAGEQPLRQEELYFIWYEEGNGVALMEGKRILAVVPPWASHDMPGYSYFAEGTGPFAWTMEQAYDNLEEKLKKCKQFWEEMESDFWQELQPSMLGVLEEFLETKEYKYYAIDGGAFPPKALVYAEKGDIRYGITLGVSIVPQPNVEQWHQEEVGAFRRIELGFACSADFPEERIMKMFSQMSGNANLPWKRLTWIGHEHTMNSEAFEGFPAALFVNTALMPELNVPRYADFMGERVNLLWVVPITEKEYKEAMTKEQPVDVLLPCYKGDKKDLIIFDGKPKFITE